MSSGSARLEARWPAPRVLRPSDDPAAAVRIMPLRAEIRSLTTSSDLLTDASQKLDAATSALQDASSTLQRLREITMQAANSTVSATDRQNMAAEIQQLMQRMLQTANSQQNQRYFFGGAQSGAPPFDLVTVNGGTSGQSLSFFFQDPLEPTGFRASPPCDSRVPFTQRPASTRA